MNKSADCREERERSRVWAWVVVFLLAVVVVYPLSVGPANWFKSRLDPFSETPLAIVLEWLYAPLGIAFIVLGEPEWFYGYVDWWTNP